MIFLYLRAHHHLVLIMSDTSNRLNVAVMLAFDAYMAALPFIVLVTNWSSWTYPEIITIIGSFKLLMHITPGRKTRVKKLNCSHRDCNLNCVIAGF